MTTQELDQEMDADPEMLDLLAKGADKAYSEKAIKRYRDAGYDASGKPLSMVKQGINKIANFTGIPEGAIQSAAEIGVSMAGTGIGAVAGGALGGPPGLVAGGMAGNSFANELAHIVGLTDTRTTMDRALDLAGPIGGIGAKVAGVGRVAKVLPSAGMALHEEAVTRVRKHVAGMRVTKDMESAGYELLKAVPDFSFIKPTKLSALLKQQYAGRSGAVAQAEKGLPGAKKDSDELSDMISWLDARPTIKFSDLEAYSKKFNQLKHSDPTNPVWSLGAHAMIDDLEATAMNLKLPQHVQDGAKLGLERFRNAVALTKSRHASEALESITEKSIQRSVGDPQLYRFDKRIFLREIEKNKDVNSAFTPGEISAMKDSVDDLGFLMSTAGGPAGTLSKGMGAATIGTALASPEHAATAAGITLSYITMAAAIKTDLGRRAIKYLTIQNKGKLNLKELESVVGKLSMQAGAGASSQLHSSQDEAINEIQE